MIDEDEDRDEDSPVGEDYGNASADDIPVATSAMKLPQQPLNPTVQAYLQKKQDLADAQDKAKQNDVISGLARAGATLSAGLARSNQAVDQKPFDAMAASDQQPVTDVLNKQKAATQDLSDQKTAQDVQKTAASQDPNSPESLAAKAMIKKLYPGKFDDSTLSNLSAAEIGDSVMKPLELDQKVQAHKDEMSQKTADRAAGVQDKADTKLKADQDKAYTNLRKDLETFRGNRPVAQASLDAYNARKAVDIVKGKDPNSLTNQDLALLADEMGKVATGGIPGEHGTQALMPNNLQTKYAEMKNFLLSKPTDAQAGEYIKHNMQYLDGMAEEANKMVGSYRANIAKGYKNRVRSDDYADAMNDYGIGQDQSAKSDAPKEHSLQDLLAEKQRRMAVKNSVQPPTSDVGGVGNILAQPQGYAYGGMIQPHLSKAPAIVMPKMEHPMTRTARFAQGGEIPGHAPIPNRDDPRNDIATIKATPGEVMLPLSVTRAKDPALAAYLYMKTMGKSHG